MVPHSTVTDLVVTISNLDNMLITEFLALAEIFFLNTAFNNKKNVKKPKTFHSNIIYLDYEFSASP